MTAGGCFCGKVRIQLNGQPLKAVSTAHRFHYIMSLYPDFLFLLGTVPLPRLSQAYRLNLFLRFRHQNCRPGGLGKSESPGQNFG
jgi:hypothetical protein